MRHSIVYLTLVLLVISSAASDHSSLEALRRLESWNHAVRSSFYGDPDASRINHGTVTRGNKTCITMDTLVVVVVVVVASHFHVQTHTNLSLSMNLRSSIAILRYG